jgi:hypothetical protein
MVFSNPLTRLHPGTDISLRSIQDEHDIATLGGEEVMAVGSLVRSLVRQ